MTEEEADAEALRRNRTVDPAAYVFYVAVEDADGTWRVEERKNEASLFSRIKDALFDWRTPGP